MKEIGLETILEEGRKFPPSDGFRRQALLSSKDEFDALYRRSIDDPEATFRSDIEGAFRVLEACRAHGIRKLVYTSSPSVVFDGRDIEGADESLPYPERHEAPYPATKAAMIKPLQAIHHR